MKPGPRRTTVLRTIDRLDVENRRVLVLADLPVGPNDVLAQRRLRAASESIQHLMQIGARVIVASHSGQRSGEAPSLVDAGALLAANLDAEVIVPDEIAGDALRRLVTQQRGREVLLLENLDLHARGSAGAEAVMQHLVGLLDSFVLDSLSAAADTWAGVDLAGRVGSSAAGLRLAAEYNAILRVRQAASRGLTLLIDDWVATDEHDALAAFVSSMGAGDHLLVDSLLSSPDPSQPTAISGPRVRPMTRIVAMAEARDVAVIWPVDYRVITSTGSGVRSASDLVPDDQPLAIGPVSEGLFARQLVRADAVAWLGTASRSQPLPRAIVEAVASRSDALCVLDAPQAAELDPHLVHPTSVLLPRDVPAIWSVLGDETLPGLASLYTDTPSG